MPNSEQPEFSILPLVIALKKTMKFIKRHKRIFIGLIVLILLIPIGIRSRDVYLDHNPPNDLLKIGTWTLTSSKSTASDGGQGTQNFRVPSNWAIAWKYNCSGKPTDFSVNVYDTNGNLDPNVISVNPAYYGTNADTETYTSGSGLQIEPIKGVYSIQIDSSICSWSVNIEPFAQGKPYETDVALKQKHVPAPTPKPTPAPTPKPTPAPSGSHVGDTQIFKKLDVTLVQVIDPATGDPDNDSTPDQGDRFIAVVFKIVNNGTAVYSDNANSDAEVIGSDNQVYSFNPNDVTQCTNFGDVGQYSLEAGDSVTGCVVFQLPLGVSVTKVQFTNDGGGDNIVGEWQVP